MTLTQLNKNIPSNYKLQWLKAKEGFTIELSKDGERVVKIGAMSKDTAIGAMKDWLVLNSLYV